MIAAAVFLIFPLCLAIAALSDLFTMTIPNRVSVILLLSFFAIALMSGMPLPMIGMHLLASMIVFGLCFTLFALNIMGGGDAKLLSAAAIWFGFDSSLTAFMVYVGFAGGLVTFFILMVRSQSNTILAIGLPVPNSLLLAKKIPYGLAIAIGGFLAYPSSPVFIAALEGLK